MVLVTLLMASLSAPDLGAEARQQFADGLRLHTNPVEAKKRFRSAARLLRMLQDQGSQNAALFRAEGNAWLLAGDIPEAILAYRRGLRHSPADPALREGLNAAREEVALQARGGLGRPPVGDRPPWLPHVGFATWSLLLVVVLYTFSCLALARWGMVRRREYLLTGLGGLLLGGALTALLGLATLYERRQNAGTLVILAREDVPLRLGNGESYSSRHAERLPRGAEARLLLRRGDWLQIELSRGEVGWVPRDATLIDE